MVVVVLAFNQIDDVLITSSGFDWMAAFRTSSQDLVIFKLVHLTIPL